MNHEQLNEVLELHKKWLNDDKGGERADLRYADLRGANLQDVNLRYADLRYADLQDVNLQDVNLRYADLRGANLRNANLYCADLYCADLQDANLQDANLQDVNLRYANLRGCSGGRDYIKSIFISDDYPITYTADQLQIGCYRHKIDEWWQFDNRAIADMCGETALKFWVKYKEFIKSAIELSPAKPTKEPEPCNS